MNEELFKLIDVFKKDKRLDSFDEAATKQVVILRILSLLGWDQYNIDEIHPEYSIGGKRVDYALRFKGQNKVFMEIKKIGEDLEKHQEQLLDYSFHQGVKLAILSNGISWWFYLPLREGNWEHRKFYTVEIYDQEDKDIVEKFEGFLSKENVISGKAIENAENLYKSQQRQHLIRETLPKAWKKIITDPDELFVDLLAETTEKLCGYKPDNEIIKRFLVKDSQPLMQNIREIPIFVKRVSTLPDHISENYIGKSVLSFAFEGKTYPVRYWREILIKICGIMFHAHKKQFNKVFSLHGEKRAFFTRNPDKLVGPGKIHGTDVYVETNFNANYIIKHSKDVLELLGYKREDLSIKCVDNKGGRNA